MKEYLLTGSVLRRLRISSENVFLLFFAENDEHARRMVKKQHSNVLNQKLFVKIDEKDEEGRTILSPEEFEEARAEADKD